MYGPGHVIAHNAIAYFHDAIGISTYGTPPPDPDRRASSIDIYNNDMHMLNDDFVETDGGVHNVRVMNNRGVNAAAGTEGVRRVGAARWAVITPNTPTMRCPFRNGTELISIPWRPPSDV